MGSSPVQLWVFALCMFSTTALGTGSMPSSCPGVSLPGCRCKCGEVEVPYPFGIREGCYKSGGYALTCEDNNVDPPKLLAGNILITNIDLQGRMLGAVYVQRDCYSKDGTPQNEENKVKWDTRGSPMSYSADFNLLVTTGCDTKVIFTNPEDSYEVGCTSVCNDVTKVPNNTCSGVGCCKIGVPKGMKHIYNELSSLKNHTLVWDFNPCSYVMLVEKDAFTFNTSFLAADYSNVPLRIPASFDWSIEGETDCEAAKKDTKLYACRSRNSECVPSNNGLGYVCKCSNGYKGNPYLEDGCAGTYS